MDRVVTHAAGFTIAMKYHHAKLAINGTPLLVALHGGTYTSEYFSVAGGPLGSFLDIASRNSYDVLTIDRPGYGGSGALDDADNTFARQAALLDIAVGEALTGSSRKVVLVGHSIGGMVALEMAALQPKWKLVGVATSGMGARIPPGGAAEQLGSLPLKGMIDLPVVDRERVMFGPAGTFTKEAQERARHSYASTPFIELVAAPTWARDRLAHIGREVKVPVHNVLAEFDALWDTSAEARAEFVSAFSGSGRVISELALGAGHSIDHHLVGSVLHLKQLAFAYDCMATKAGEAPGAPSNTGSEPLPQT